MIRVENQTVENGDCVGVVDVLIRHVNALNLNQIQNLLFPFNKWVEIV